MNDTRMVRLFRLLPAAALLMGLQPAAATDFRASGLAAGNDKISAKAGGAYEIVGTTADIELKPKQKSGEAPTGSFRHSLIFEEFLIDFSGEVTCMAVDAASGRAWIGGIITENNSEHPSYVAERNLPGADIWFRVLDNPDNDDDDRSTFVGFEGDGDIITSQEYCEAQIWPGPPDDEPNARTNPMSRGSVKVKPKAN